MACPGRSKDKPEAICFLPATCARFASEARVVDHESTDESEAVAIATRKSGVMLLAMQGIASEGELMTPNVMYTAKLAGYSGRHRTNRA